MGIWKDMVARGSAKMHAQNIAETFLRGMAANRKPTDLMMLPTVWDASKVPLRAIVEQKHDGIHLGYSAWHRVPFTREGVDFTCASHLMSALETLDAALGRPHVLFGEYLNLDGFNATLADFSRGVGAGIVVLFDAVPMAAWTGAEPSPPLHQRKARLAAAHARLSAGQREGVKLCKASLFEGAARDNIELVAGQMWADGFEGIVIKDADSPYVRGPSDHWMKLKQQNTVDLPITGQTIVGGRLQSITVEATPGVPSKVGVGFSESDRANPLRFVQGRMVEVSHLGLTARGALKSGAFKRFRDDKTGGK
jgi:ATP-dependent DNA ligase